jgi:hypothetical protein
MESGMSFFQTAFLSFPPGPFVKDAFFILLMVKSAGLLLSAALVLRLVRATGKLAEFWRQYWRGKSARENVLDLAVWLATLGGYGYSLRMLGGGGGPASGPPMALALLAAVAWLFVSTLLQTISCVRRTHALCEEMLHPPIIEAIGRWAGLLSMIVLELSGWGEILGAGSLLLRPVLERIEENAWRRAVEGFFFLAAAELSVRVAVVAAARFASTGSWGFW